MRDGGDVKGLKRGEEEDGESVEWSGINAFLACFHEADASQAMPSDSPIPPSA